MPSAVQVTGSVFRSYVTALEQRGLVEKVKARVSPAIRELFARPPLATAWLDAAQVDEVMAAVIELEGEATAEDIGYGVVRDGTAKVLAPLLSVYRSMGESSPAAFFTRLNVTGTIMMRGLSYAFEDVAPNAGVLELQYVEPVSRARFVVWRGTVRYLLDHCGVKGELTRMIVAPDRRKCRYEMRWSA